MSRPFIHLHNHTEYSLLDGAAVIKKLVAKAKDSGAPAVAMTDHGNMYGAIKFYKECLSQRIKPIIGCEFYTCEDISKKEGRDLNHLVLLAKNNTGYKNISKLNSISYIEGSYYKPRIDLAVLERHSEGLICLSACLAGAVPRLLLQNDYEGAKKYALRLKSMFAEGDFYIEIQDHGLPEQKATNPLLVKIAREIGVKCVATNDVHYINKSDAEMHDILLCVQTGSYYDEPNRMRFTGEEFYYKSREEMEDALGWCAEAMETPYEISEKCDVSFKFKDYQLPEFKCPEDMPAPDYLRQITYEGLVKRYGKVTKALGERAENELEVIISMGFSEYYLIVWDFIRYAKKSGIPVGPGRGSGVGSLVAYAIEITDVDPIKYNLIFERFLNKDRTSMPDFDIDFCFNRRDEVIRYVKDKYGEDHISQIITFGRLKKKAAIKDVARAFRIPFSDVTKLTKNIGNFGENDKKVHIGDLINPESSYAVPELIKLYNEFAEYKKVIDIAIKVEGLPRNTSVHAAGVVIYKNPAAETIPLAKNGDEITTQFDMNEVENLGLLKMDFLALMTLTDIQLSHDYVFSRTGIDIDFNKLGYDDPEVYNLIGSGNTDAVFQLEGGGMTKFMTQFKPSNLEEIIAGIALYRPGPMDNIKRFLSNRENPANIEYKHPALKEILEVTYGIIVYQEQAMMITRVLAGYDMTRADRFRSIISKKKMDLIPEECNAFVYGVEQDGKVVIPGCIRNGVDEQVALSIFKEMESFASYAFNKSHAAAYAVLGYQTAFYRRYYPVEFMASVINNRITKPDDTAKYMRVMKNMGIPLVPPDINKSAALFSPSGNEVRYGLACFKHVGAVAIEQIISERETKGPYKSFDDFLERNQGSGLNKRMIESLIIGGAFDCFGMTRSTLLANYEHILSLVENRKKLADSNQMDMFTMLGETQKPFEYEFMTEFSNRDKLLREKEILGSYVTGHPLSGLEKDFESFNFNTSMLPKKKAEEDEGEEEEAVYEDAEIIGNLPLSDGMDVTTGGILSEISIKRTKDGKEMAIIVLEDLYDSVELIAFSRALSDIKNYLVKDALVRIRGRLNIRDGEIKLTLTDLRPWELEEKEPEEPLRCIYINLTDGSLLTKISDILEAHPGRNPVKIQFENKIYAHPVSVSDIISVSRELTGIIGENNLKIR